MCLSSTSLPIPLPMPPSRSGQRSSVRSKPVGSSARVFAGRRWRINSHQRPPSRRTATSPSTICGQSVQSKPAWPFRFKREIDLLQSNVDRSSMVPASGIEAPEGNASRAAAEGVEATECGGAEENGISGLDAAIVVFRGGVAGGGHGTGGSRRSPGRVAGTLNSHFRRTGLPSDKQPKRMGSA